MLFRSGEVLKEEVIVGLLSSGPFDVPVNISVSVQIGDDTAEGLEVESAVSFAVVDEVAMEVGDLPTVELVAG